MTAAVTVALVVGLIPLIGFTIAFLNYRSGKAAQDQRATEAAQQAILQVRTEAEAKAEKLILDARVEAQEVLHRAQVEAHQVKADAEVMREQAEATMAASRTAELASKDRQIAELMARLEHITREDPND